VAKRPQAIHLFPLFRPSPLVSKRLPPPAGREKQNPGESPLLAHRCKPKEGEKGLCKQSTKRANSPACPLFACPSDIEKIKSKQRLGRLGDPGQRINKAASVPITSSTSAPLVPAEGRPF